MHQNRPCHRLLVDLTWFKRDEAARIAVKIAQVPEVYFEDEIGRRMAIGRLINNAPWDCARHRPFAGFAEDRRSIEVAVPPLPGVGEVGVKRASKCFKHRDSKRGGIDVR
jgi:hypothetical protein